MHLLPARQPVSGQSYRGTVLVSSPFLFQDTFECDDTVFLSIPSQVLPLASDPTSYGLPWEAGPQPMTDPDRAENRSVLVMDLTPAAGPEARVYLAAGRETPFSGPELATAEVFTNPQMSSPPSGTSLPSLNISRIDTSFLLIPGRRLLGLGGDKNLPTAPPILQPEMLDLDDALATWIKLAPHAQERPYHS